MSNESQTITWKEPSQPNDYIWNYTITVTDYITSQEVNRTELHMNATKLTLSSWRLCRFNYSISDG